MWNNSYRTPTERWQKNSKRQENLHVTEWGKRKKKEKKRGKGIGMGPVPLEGSCEGGKVSTH